MKLIKYKWNVYDRCTINVFYESNMLAAVLVWAIIAIICGT